MSKSMQYQLAKIFECSKDDPRIIEFLRLAVSEARKYQPHYYDSSSMKWKQGYNDGIGQIIIYYSYTPPELRDSVTLD